MKPMAILIDREVACEMRDGCVLRANIYRPAQEGRYPVLMFRTPYDKNAAGNQSMALDPLRMVEAGYIVVQQDTRGRAASQGVHSPWIDEYTDGYDTTEWAARQPWSNGVVGAYGISYHGLTSWTAAAMAPPALRAIAASQAPRDHFDVFWRGGAFELGMFVHWTVRVMGPTELLRARARLPSNVSMRQLQSLVAQIDDYESLVRDAPLRGLPAKLADEPYFTYISEILAHTTDDEFHRSRSLTGRYGNVKVPVLITAGWHDVLLRSDLKHYQSIRSEGGSKEAREQSCLVIGPWTHGAGLHVSAAGEVDYGLRSSGLSLDLREDLTGYHQRWFNYWLKGGPEHGFGPVRIFVMGENRWRDEVEWPLARATPTPWYLHSQGGLAPGRPARGTPPRAYVQDPNNPFPTVGGATLMPPAYPRGSVAQNVLFDRPDALTFTSEVLTEALEVTGYVQAVLWASTSARDADWMVKLCDVHPDGRSFNVCDGIVRASRRDRAWNAPRPVSPGEILRYEVSLLATSILFRSGHRLQLLVTSSDFPRYDRNPGTGDSSFESARFEAALHQVYCDCEHPSHVLLPVVARS
jgi:putative CocE/NonD family hydrolase